MTLSQIQSRKAEGLVAIHFYIIKPLHNTCCIHFIYIFFLPFNRIVSGFPFPRHTRKTHITVIAKEGKYFLFCQMTCSSPFLNIKLFTKILATRRIAYVPDIHTGQVGFVPLHQARNILPKPLPSSTMPDHKWNSSRLPSLGIDF